jgi:hypothetical protein
MPSIRGNLLLAASLVVAELVMAYAVGFSIWPFLLCAVLFILGIAAVLRMEDRKPRSAARAANFICFLLVMKVCFLLVAGTGGATSNFTGILYVPIFLAALFYFIPGSVGVGASVAIFLVLITASGNTPEASEAKDTSLALAGVFLFVSLVAGIFSHGLTRSARLATRRAHLQQRRAAEFEWFMDTSIMMESLRDLDTMLSAGLMRLQELLPGTSAAFYLREMDGLEMHLARHASIGGREPGKSKLTMKEQDPLRIADLAVAFWPDTSSARKEMGAFRQIYPEACFHDGSESSHDRRHFRRRCR